MRVDGLSNESGVAGWSNQYVERWMGKLASEKTDSKSVWVNQYVGRWVVGSVQG